jgi:hypothetical protein
MTFDLFMRACRRVKNALAGPDVIFYILPALMILLVAGTIAQHEMGLYAAQQKFFNSFVIWAGPVPFPGGIVLLSVFTISLLAKFIFASPWRWVKAGVILAHLGALIVMCGGLISAVSQRDGYMILQQGQPTPYFYDYTRRVLFVFRDDILLDRIDFASLQAGVTQSWDDFLLRILSACQNCSIQERKSDPNVQHHFSGMARFMELLPIENGKEPEADLSGVTFELVTRSPEKKIYVAFEGMPQPISFKTQGGTEYKIMFGKDQTLLPFSLSLQHFQKTSYPGTSMARAYKSEVMIVDDGAQWPAHMSMNKPLNYKGYTFFQSAFEEGPQGAVSIISVTQNPALLFPYIGLGLLTLGLMLHAVLHNLERRERQG